MNEKKVLNDAVVGIDGRLVEADRKVEFRTFTKTQTPRTESTVTYEPHGTSGSHLDTNALVYELMIIAGCDMIEVGSAVFSGDYTAAELAGNVDCLPMFMENDSKSCECYYTHIHIKTKTFDCSFDAGDVFETIAEWEGVAGITNAKAYKFHCEGKEMPKGAALKKYQRCHGYKPTHISLAMNERRINEKFEVLGTLYRNLTSEGMRKAMSVCAAARYFEHMDREWLHMAKEAMRWKFWRDYAKKEDGVLAQPISFSATNFCCGPDCYKVVDDKYVQELVAHVQKMIADAPKPEWPSKGDVVMFKNRDVWGKRKYQGKHLVDSIVPRLSVYGNRIEWRVAVRVGKFECEYFMPGQLEAAEEKKPKAKSQKPKATTDSADKTDKPKAISPQPSIADKLREALMARLSA